MQPFTGSRLTSVMTLLVIMTCVGFVLKVQSYGAPLGDWLYFELGLPHKFLRRANEYQSIFLGLVILVQLFWPHYLNLALIGGVLLGNTLLSAVYGSGIQSHLQLPGDLILYGPPMLMGAALWKPMKQSTFIIILRVLYSVYLLVQGVIFYAQRELFSDMIALVYYRLFDLTMSPTLAPPAVLILAGGWVSAAVALPFTVSKKLLWPLIVFSTIYLFSWLGFYPRYAFGQILQSINIAAIPLIIYYFSITDRTHSPLTSEKGPTGA